MKFTLEIELGNEGAKTVGDVKALLVCAMDTCTVPNYEGFSVGWSRILPSVNGRTAGKWEVTESAQL